MHGEVLEADWDLRLLGRRGRLIEREVLLLDGQLALRFHAGCEYGWQGFRCRAVQVDHDSRRVLLQFRICLLLALICHDIFF